MNRVQWSSKKHKSIFLTLRYRYASYVQIFQLNQAFN